MHLTVRKAITTYIAEKRFLTVEECPNDDIKNYSTSTDLVWVTLYRDGEVIASRGRVKLRKPSSLLEAVDLSIEALQDPRFAQSVKAPSEISEVKIRVDTIATTQRRIIKAPSEIEIGSEGLIVICQKLNMISVILPSMAQRITNGQELYELACRKSGVKTSDIGENEAILYAIKSTISRDF